MPIYHVHHIVPVHAGGTDDPSNLIKLTVEEHAEAHKKLWEDHGRWQDKLAWEMLSGKTTDSEQARKAASRYALFERRGKFKLSDEHKEQIRQQMKGRVFTEEWKKKISDSKKGKPAPCRHTTPHTEETKRKMSAAQKGRTPWNKGLKKTTGPDKTDVVQS